MISNWFLPWGAWGESSCLEVQINGQTLSFLKELYLKFLRHNVDMICSCYHSVPLVLEIWSIFSVSCNILLSHTCDGCKSFPASHWVPLASARRRVQTIGDVASKGSWKSDEKKRWWGETSLQHTCVHFCSARIMLVQCVSERQLCRRLPVKCEKITANKQEGHLFSFSFLASSSFPYFILERGKYDCLKSYFAKAECAEMQSKEPLWEEISVLYRVASWDYLEWISWETSRNFFPLKTDGSFPFKCFKSCGELKIEALL